MAEEVKTAEETEQTTPEESKPKRKKVTFTKNVKCGNDKRYKKGESALVDAALVEDYEKQKVIE
jgi:hypothetical protein